MRIFKALLHTSFFALSFVFTTEISAQETPNARAAEIALSSDEDFFRPGGSCASLAYISHVGEMIRTGSSDDRHSFCYPEEPSECSDYTGLLHGHGRLTTSEDGYHCDLQPRS